MTFLVATLVWMPLLRWLWQQIDSTKSENKVCLRTAWLQNALQDWDETFLLTKFPSMYFELKCCQKSAYEHAPMTCFKSQSEFANRKSPQKIKLLIRRSGLIRRLHEVWRWISGTWNFMGVYTAYPWAFLNCWRSTEVFFSSQALILGLFTCNVKLKVHRSRIFFCY